MSQLKVKSEELIYMIGELYIEKFKIQQVATELATQIAKIKKEENGETIIPDNKEEF